ncbi:MAG: hypothetical protein J7K73_02040 [Nanoarchaeota archaeon]|nr:hypothetical protein [Nanoarchaeota archaeon]
MPRQLLKGVMAGILAGIVLGISFIVLGYLFNPLFLTEGMSFTGTAFVLTAMVAGILYGMLFGGAYRIVYHSLPHTFRGMYYGLFIWAVSGVVSIVDSIIFMRASIAGSALYLVMTFIAYIIFGFALEYLYEFANF